jgi:hypothetical protein
MVEIRPQSDYFAPSPQKIQIQAGVVYERKLGHYAVHYSQPGQVADGALLQMNEGAIAVFQGEPQQVAPQTGEVGPVYATAAGTWVIPTGQVFVEFAPGQEIAQYRSALQTAGYDITQNLDYAPNAAWLRARSGKIADGLAGLNKLRAIANVVTVEPEMLMPRSKR